VRCGRRTNPKFGNSNENFSQKKSGARFLQLSFLLVENCAGNGVFQRALWKIIGSILLALRRAPESRTRLQMNCLTCGRFISSEVEAVCSEICREEAVKIYTNVVNHAPVCSKNRNPEKPNELRADLKSVFESLLEKFKAAPVYKK
jgi:hypothetical protein